MDDDRRSSAHEIEQPAGTASGDGPWPLILSAVFLFAGLLLRLLHYLANRSLWVDEAMLVRNILDRGPLELLRPLDYNQGAPVLFLLLVDAASALFGSGELALRLVPFLASLLSLPLFFLAARLLLCRWYVPLAVFIFAVSGELVYYSQEVKQYAMDVAVAIALTYLSLRIVKSARRSKADVLILGASGGVAVFLSHPAGFVLAAVASTLIALKASRRLDVSFFDLGLIAGIWLLCSGINYVLFLRPLSGSDALHAYWTTDFLPLSVGKAALRAWLHAGDDLLSCFGYGVGFTLPQTELVRWQVFVLALAGVAVGSAAARRTASSLMIVLYFVFAVAASVLGVYPFGEGRLVLYLFPFVILLVVRGLQILAQGRAVVIGVVLTACLLAPSLNSLRALVSQPIQHEEVRPLLAYLDSHRRPGDQVYVYYGASDVVKYYRRHEGPDADFFHYGARSRDDPSRYIADIDSMKRWRRVWFLFAHVHDHEEAFFLSHIDGDRLDRRNAYGASLYLYSFPSGEVRP